MINITELINKEDQRNNGLRQILENEGRFPSEDVAKEIGAEELYRIASDTIEFGIKIRLKILQSDYHLVELMKSVKNDPNQNAVSLDNDRLQKMIDYYSSDSERMSMEIVGYQMRGYEASW